jgi:hypothetical protein
MHIANLKLILRKIWENALFTFDSMEAFTSRYASLTIRGLF